MNSAPILVARNWASSRSEVSRSASMARRSVCEMCCAIVGSFAISPSVNPSLPRSSAAMSARWTIRSA
jgi:hypothetical protein